MSEHEGEGDDLPRGVIIRAEQAGDHEAIADVVAAAFDQAAIARLVDAIRASPHYLPQLALVAEADGRVVGHVMISYAELQGESSRRVAALSPLAVEASFRRRGIGAALVRAAVRRAEAFGEPCVVVEGSPRYYGRLGFEHSVRYGIEITLPHWAPPEAAQVRILSSYDPSIKGRVVYPPAFAEVIEA